MTVALHPLFHKFFWRVQGWHYLYFTRHKLRRYWERGALLPCYMNEQSIFKFKKLIFISTAYILKARESQLTVPTLQPEECSFYFQVTRGKIKSSLFTPCRHIDEWRYSSTNSYPTLDKNVFNLTSRTLYSPWRSPDTNWVRGLLDPIANLDNLEKG